MNAKILAQALKRIKQVAESQYNEKSPASSDLCDHIAAIAADALEEAK